MKAHIQNMKQIEERDWGTRNQLGLDMLLSQPETNPNGNKINPFKTDVKMGGFQSQFFKLVSLGWSPIGLARRILKNIGEVVMMHLCC